MLVEDRGPAVLPQLGARDTHDDNHHEERERRQGDEVEITDEIERRETSHRHQTEKRQLED